MRANKRMRVRVQGTAELQGGRVRREGMADRIPYSRPFMRPGDDEAVAEVIREGRLVMGERVAGFERAIARFVGRRHAIAVTSGTGALELALRGLGVGPGWDVFVPAYTWVATGNVPLLLGARPVLVDVDPADYCMAEAGLREALAGSTSRRRLVMPVHLFGYRAGRGWLDGVAREHALVVMGDGCCAFGGRDGEEVCGAWSAVECLSFHPRKVITTGEGGMVLLDDDALADELRRMRDHGAVRSPEQRAQTTRGGPDVPVFPGVGLNLRMTEMQGALGLRQVLHLEEILQGRRRVAARYDELLKDAPGWIVPAPGAGDPGRLLTCYVVRVASEALRAVILKDLAEEGIAARPPMISLLDVPHFKNAAEGRGFTGTELVASTAFGLPLFPELTDEGCERVVAAVLRSGTRRWTA